MSLSPEELRRQMLEERTRQARLQAETSAAKDALSDAGSNGASARPSGAARITPVPILRLAPVVPEASEVSDAPVVFSAPPASPLQPTTPSPVVPPPQASVPVTPPTRSSTPISVPTFVRFFKLCITAGIVITGSYFAVKSAYPFLMELSHPGSLNAADPKDVPTSVKILQQTRAVVAKNNANVEQLDSIIDGAPDGMLREPLAAAVPGTFVLPSLPPQPVSMPPKPKPKPQIRLERLTGLVIDELHISGVMGGKRPRIMVDGVMVGVGGIVDATRRLRFVSIDESRRVIVFGNGQETIEKSY